MSSPRHHNHGAGAAARHPIPSSQAASADIPPQWNKPQGRDVFFAGGPLANRPCLVVIFDRNHKSIATIGNFSTDSAVSMRIWCDTLLPALELRFKSETPTQDLPYSRFLRFDPDFLEDLHVETLTGTRDGRSKYKSIHCKLPMDSQSRRSAWQEGKLSEDPTPHICQDFIAKLAGAYHVIVEIEAIDSGPVMRKVEQWEQVLENRKLAPRPMGPTNAWWSARQIRYDICHPQQAYRAFASKPTALQPPVWWKVPRKDVYCNVYEVRWTKHEGGPHRHIINARQCVNMFGQAIIWEAAATTKVNSSKIITLDIADPTLLRQLLALERLSIQDDDQERHLFAPQDLVFSYPIDRRSSPNQMSIALAKWPGNPADLARVFDFIDKLNQIQNVDQQDFMDTVLLGGTPSCALFLHGCPGSGKTTSLAFAIAALALMGRKTLVVAQTNRAVELIVSEVLVTLDIAHGQHNLSDLTKHVIRLYPSAVEHRICRELVAQAGEEVVLEEEEVVHSEEAGLKAASLSSRIDEYCRQHRGDHIVERYLEARILQAQDKKQDKKTFADSGKNSYDVVLGYLRRTVFEEALVVGATTTMAYDLFDNGFEADVVVIDEMNDVSEPAALVPLTMQKAGLAIFAGDNNRLSPATFSPSGKNPLAAILQLSFAERWLHAAPQPLQQICLWDNYRQCDDVFDLSNKLFYESKMRKAREITGDEKIFHNNITRFFARNNFCKGIFGARPTRRLFFVNVETPDTYDPVTISRYNRGGIDATKEMIQDLLTLPGLNQRDILVTSFHNLDAKEMTIALRQEGLQDVRVSSLISPQVAPARVVILHYVWGSSGNNKGTFNAFMADGRRLNVVTSRANDLLLMVGNMAFWDTHMKQQGAQYHNSVKALGSLVDYLKSGRFVTDWD